MTEETECPDCDIKMKKHKRKYYVKILLGEYDVEECVKCGSVYFSEKSMIEMEKAAKERGVFGWKKKVIEE